MASNPAYFYICQHEAKRNYPVTDKVLGTAADYGYNSLTAPITKESYQARVLQQLASHEDSLSDNPLSPLSVEETDLEPSDVNSHLMLTASSWIDLTSSDDLISQISRTVLRQEITHASFCGAANLLIRGPRPTHGLVSRDGAIRFAHAIKEALELSSNLHFHIALPVAFDPDSASQNEYGDLCNMAQSARTRTVDEPLQTADVSPLDSWDVWNVVRTVSKYSPRLLLALQIPSQLPPVFVQSRWLSEPVGMMELSHHTFKPNEYGHDTLTKGKQELILQFMRVRNPPWILLSDVGPIPGIDSNSSSALNSGHDPTPAEAASNKDSQKPPKSTTAHLDYFRGHLQKIQMQYNPTAMENYGTGWQEYLQNPLQPLTDNLESIQYEVFEKDPIKYAWYEKAIEQALLDWKALHKSSSSNKLPVVAIVGAGRGPLVTRAIRASENTQIPIELWALEKNPNAYVVLQRHNQNTWKKQVTLVHSDMRSWKGPTRGYREHGVDQGDSYYVQIFVSELLGSFGDNELSPECIDGVQRFLDPNHGVSIPQSYTAHLTPIAAPKLHTDISIRSNGGDHHAAEIPYVVMLQAIDFLSSETGGVDTKGEPKISQRTRPIVKEMWEFSHPVPQSLLEKSKDNQHNTRFSRIAFPCHKRGTCHGLAGYFEAVLYAPQRSSALDSHSQPGDTVMQSNGHASGGDRTNESQEISKVELSTNPLTEDQKSKDMISWFPIYFPLKSPLYFPEDSELQISMWRRTDGKKVWYEWFVESYLVMGNKKVRLGSSDLHSSIKDACLM